MHDFETVDEIYNKAKRVELELCSPNMRRLVLKPESPLLVESLIFKIIVLHHQVIVQLLNSKTTMPHPKGIVQHSQVAAQPS